MISHKHQCIFIHIPKAAGTSVEVKLTENRNQAWPPDHRAIRDIEPFNLYKLSRICRYPELFSLCRRAKYAATRRKAKFIELGEKAFKNYFKFTIIRNPWARVFSWYYSALSDPRYKINPKTSFKTYLKTYAGHPAFRPQLYWMLDSKEKIPFDFICRFERLKEDFRVVADQLNLDDGSLPHKRKRCGPDQYLTAYDKETRDLVTDRYKHEIKMFGYKFDS